MLELIKGLVRPFLIVWGVIFYTVCFFSTYDCPVLVSGFIGAILVEYVGERAVKRLQEM